MKHSNKNKEKTIQELTDKYLSERAVEEFDEIITKAENKKHRKKVSVWSVGITAAASIALAVIFSISTSKTQVRQIYTVDIAEGINMLMALDIGEVESITAIPTGATALLTAKMKDGSTFTYILACDAEDNGTISLLAMK